VDDLSEAEEEFIYNLVEACQIEEVES